LHHINMGELFLKPHIKLLQKNKTIQLCLFSAQSPTVPKVYFLKTMVYSISGELICSCLCQLCSSKPISWIFFMVSCSLS
jgi:hypothetical protein